MSEESIFVIYFVLCELTGISMIPLTFNSLLFDKALAMSRADTILCL